MKTDDVLTAEAVEFLQVTLRTSTRNWSSGAIRVSRGRMFTR